MDVQIQIQSQATNLAITSTLHFLVCCIIAVTAQAKQNNQETLQQPVIVLHGKLCAESHFLRLQGQTPDLQRYVSSSIKSHPIVDFPFKNQLHISYNHSNPGGPQIHI